MKKNVLLIALLLIAFSMQAQTTPSRGHGRMKNKMASLSPNDKASRAADYWKKELNLTDGQATAFQQAKVAQLTEHKTILAKYEGDKQAAKPELKKANEAFHAAIKASFGESLFAQWQAKRKAMAGKMKGMSDDED